MDRVQLRARGWTLTLIEQFLVRPDSWAPVNHYRNFTGKATYFVERVMLAEQHVKFQYAFEASRKRRKLSAETLLSIQAERVRGNRELHLWRQTLIPQDLKEIVAFKQIANIFAQARASGYRTPHKC